MAQRPPTHGEPIEALPAHLPVRTDRAALGQRLFRDSSLSRDGSVACTSCHLTEHGGADHAPLSHVLGGTVTRFNTPSIFNLAFTFRYSWTGAFDDIETQLDEAFARTMGLELPATVERLRPRYGPAFAASYPGGLTAASVRNALAVYVRSLFTPDARFDRWLRGDAAALGEEEKQGYVLFKDLGCASCHQGANVGGNLFQRMGIAEDYFATRGTPVSDADVGRFALTADPADRHVFRVPSLRNVARTAPYFHDGSASTLDDAIATMARFQLGREVEPEDRRLIAAFLTSLTGELEGRPL